MILSVKSLINQIFTRELKIISLVDEIESANYRMRSIGIGNYGNLEITGEAYLLEYLAKNISGPKSIIFDVGANIGSNKQYVNYLRRNFPFGQIYAFEPNASAYRALCSATRGDELQHNLQYALGAKKGKLTHYSYTKLSKTELASSNKQIFVDILKSREKLLSYVVKVITIDGFCKKQHINHINYLKIDVEGSELDVLIGAKGMLSDKCIDYIQFEFNIHNIYSRTFIKDFYDILSGYYFYRLAQNRLIPLGNYSTDYEVFRYQNIFASKHKLKL